MGDFLTDYKYGYGDKISIHNVPPREFNHLQKMLSIESITGEASEWCSFSIGTVEITIFKVCDGKEVQQQEEE